MTEIFLSPSRPFYQSVITMGLNPISEDKYTVFAIHQFESNGKTLDAEVVNQIYQRFDGVTAYLQRVMNVLFMNTGKGEHCTVDMIEEAIDFIINLNSEHYETLFSQMSEKQRVSFLAIAKEGRAQNISSSQFVRKYRLISPSSVVSAVRGLLEKDFITQENNEYYVYDYFFRTWLEKRGYV
jgi:tRNA uridine 5-carbamoylmethylation protein Kti12